MNTFDNAAAMLFIALFIPLGLYVLKLPLSSIRSGDITWRGWRFQRSQQPFQFWFFTILAGLVGCSLFATATLVVSVSLYMLITGKQKL